MEIANSYTQKIEINLNEATIGLFTPLEWVLKAFEDAAGKSADSLGFGWANINLEHKVWVVNKIKVVFNTKLIAPFSANLTTWPVANDTEKYASNRDFYIKDESLNIVAYGVSKWCLLDLEKRSLCKIEEINHLIKVPLRTDRVSDLEYTKVAKAENAKLCFLHKVRLSDLDLNGHLNNKKYAVLAVDTLDESEFLKGIKTFEISYNSECFLNDEIAIYRSEKNGAIEVVGMRAEKIVFTARIELF